MLPHDSLEKSVTDAVIQALDEREEKASRLDNVGKIFRCIFGSLVVIFLIMAMLGQQKIV